MRIQETTGQSSELLSAAPDARALRGWRAAAALTAEGVPMPERLAVAERGETRFPLSCFVAGALALDPLIDPRVGLSRTDRVSLLRACIAISRHERQRHSRDVAAAARRRAEPRIRRWGR
jgi:hypothetical protein